MKRECNLVLMVLISVAANDAAVDVFGRERAMVGAEEFKGSR
jgi:hypothetical protein